MVKTVHRPVLVLDNDGVFKSKRVQRYLARHGIPVVYLPPNTPLYQVIEPTFRQAKEKVRRWSKDRPNASHKQLLEEAFAEISKRQCRNYFRSLGF